MSPTAVGRFFFLQVQLLDEEAYPGELGHMVWDRALHLESNATGRDAIEFRRLGSRNVKARLTLWLACHVDRLALAPKLVRGARERYTQKCCSVSELAQLTCWAVPCRHAALRFTARLVSSLKDHAVVA